MIDAHVHIWDPAMFDYPWLEGAGDRAAPHLPADIDRCDGETTSMVFVEAGSALRQAGDEARWVRELRRVWPELAAIVARVDLRDPRLDEHLDALQEIDLVRGVRHELQVEDSARLADPALVRGLQRVAARGFSFDACVRSDQLHALAALVERIPDADVVLDHVGNPTIAAGIESAQGQEWCAAIGRLARHRRVFVKLSGMPAAAPDRATLERHAPAYLAYAATCFGSDRAMFGSDWPVSSRWGAGGSVREWRDLVRRALDGRVDLRAVEAGTARDFYKLHEDIERGGGDQDER